MGKSGHTILITGSDGQLGRSIHRLVRDELTNSSKATGLLATIASKEVLSQCEWIFTAREAVDDFVPDRLLDITSVEDIRNALAETEAEIIVNCAAYTNVENAQDEPAAAYAVNASAVANLALAAKTFSAALIHFSTDYVFDGKSSKPYTEDDFPAPLSVYGESKLRGEEEMKGSGCKGYIIRTSGLFSEYGHNFVRTMLALTKQRSELKVVNDQSVSPTYAGDLAAFCLNLIAEYLDGNLQTLGVETLNFTNEGSCTWFSLACEVASLAGNKTCRIIPCSTEEYPVKATRPHYSVLDKSKVKKLIGISIPQWRDSLREALGKM